MHETGGPEVLRIEEVADPQAGEGEVLVRVEAAGINRYDLNQRARGATSLPLILGRDAAGTRVDTGERVVLTGGRGTYAELVTVREASVWPLPDSVPADVAAAFATPYRAAWWALAGVAGLEQGETLLVQGGASSTGQACADLGRALGATVYATASEPKHGRLRELGAEPLAYDDPRLDDVVANVVFDPVGADTFARSVQALARDGRLVTPGALGRPEVELNVWSLVGKRARIHGIAGEAAPREALDRLIEMLGAGELHPVVERTLPLEQAAEAHRLIEAREAVGRVVLRP